MENNPFFDIYIDEGTDFTMYLSLNDVSVDGLTGVETATPVDLSQITALRAKVKKDFSAGSPTLFSFTVLVTDALTGEIGLSLSRTASVGLLEAKDPTQFLGYYDIILTKSTGTEAKLVSGKVFINQTISII
jgi:hypothetical protein